MIPETVFGSRLVDLGIGLGLTVLGSFLTSTGKHIVRRRDRFGTALALIGFLSWVGGFYLVFRVLSARFPAFKWPIGILLLVVLTFGISRIRLELRQNQLYEPEQQPEASKTEEMDGCKSNKKYRCTECGSTYEVNPEQCETCGAVAEEFFEAI